MNDLISRQDAITKLRESERISARRNGKLKNEGAYIQRHRDFVEMYEILRDLPSAQQWIPCSKGLPEEGKRVIVQYGDGSLGVIERVSLKIWNIINSPYAKVVAWMPAPESWKEVADEHFN